MMSRAGAAGALPQGHTPRMRDPSEIQWNEQTKSNMLKFLDQSIMVGTAMRECLMQSDNQQQLKQCMASKKPAS
jgi:hypothetical protein